MPALRRQSVHPIEMYEPTTSPTDDRRSANAIDFGQSADIDWHIGTSQPENQRLPAAADEVTIANLQALLTAVQPENVYTLATCLPRRMIPRSPGSKLAISQRVFHGTRTSQRLRPTSPSAYSHASTLVIQGTDAVHLSTKCRRMSTSASLHQTSLPCKEVELQTHSRPGKHSRCVYKHTSLPVQHSRNSDTTCTFDEVDRVKRDHFAKGPGGPDVIDSPRPRGVRAAAAPPNPLRPALPLMYCIYLLLCPCYMFLCSGVVHAYPGRQKPKAAPSHAALLLLAFGI
jgi:hypothetical protein